MSEFEENKRIKEVEKLINGDSKFELKKIKSNSIDLIVTDPPYSMNFMGLEFDKALPDKEIWKQCLRVLKPGAFAFVMCIPRSDLQSRMAMLLEEVGFNISFTPIYYTFATGFPKSANISKMVDKRLGYEREEGETIPASKEAKELVGSYAGFSVKPALEVVLVAMKKLSEGSYIDQALFNKKGITWLDDGRIPTSEQTKTTRGKTGTSGFPGDHANGEWKPNIKAENKPDWELNNKSRFPANLLVSDDILNDGTTTKAKCNFMKKEKHKNSHTISFEHKKGEIRGHDDEGSFSRYYDLDAWFNKFAKEKLPENVAKTFPFIITPKPSASEKNKGLEHLPKQKASIKDFRPTLETNPENWKTPIQETPYGGANRGENQTNSHPTVKPIKLMTYLIKIGSRKGDIVLDPFLGSGTTAIACVLSDRNYIGIELDENYFKIALNRLTSYKKEKEKINRKKYYARRL